MSILPNESQLHHHQIVGEFVTKVNTFEFLINSMIEQVLVHYSPVMGMKKQADTMIDLLEGSSIRVRIESLIVLLVLTNSDNPFVEEIVDRLKDHAVYYNKDVRKIRDFIAHNPTFEGENLRVISARRMQSGMNSLELSEIEKVTKEIGPKVKEWFETLALINQLYPVELVREIEGK